MLAAPARKAVRDAPAAVRARPAAPGRDPAGAPATARMRPSVSWGRMGPGPAKDSELQRDVIGPVAGAGGGLHSGGAPNKTVDVFAMQVGNSSRNPSPDITRADAVWAQANVKVSEAGGQSVTGEDLDLMAPTGVLNEFTDPKSPTAEETALRARRPGGPNVLHAYFVPSMSQGSRGEAFTPSDGVPAVFISDSAASDSLAHEIGHVLLDDGNHHPDPDNLMASGSIRNVGVDHLDPDQCNRIK